MTHKRLYSETDIGALLKRATELQEASEQDPGHGLSLDEIEQIACDLGIDASILRSAAIELENDPVGTDKIDFWGGPFTSDEQCVIEGEVSKEDWELLVQDLRHISGEIGTVSEFGSVREWMKKKEDLEYTQVSIGGRGNQTTIRVREQFRLYAVYTYSGTIPALIGLSIAFVVASSLPPFPALAIAVTSLLSVLGLERFILSRWARKRRHKARDLVNHLRQYVVQPETELRDSGHFVNSGSGNTPARLDDVPDEESQVGTLHHKTRIR